MHAALDYCFCVSFVFQCNNELFQNQFMLFHFAVSCSLCICVISEVENNIWVRNARHKGMVSNLK